MPEPTEGVYARLPQSPTAAAFDGSWFERGVSDVFALCAERHAQSTALECPGRRISYAELDDLAGRIAAYISKGDRPQSRSVAIVLGHEDPVPAAILGASRAGVLSVCLDPSYPVERNRFILDDAGAGLILTNRANLDAAETLAGDKSSLGVLEEIEKDCDPLLTSLRPGDPHDLFHILYTSGSTGKPKGVMRTHGAVLHNAMRHISSRQIGASERIGLLFSYSFAAAGSNVFAALLAGATVVPFRLRELGLTRLAEWLGSEGITQIHTVPTLFRRLAPEVSRLGLSLADLKLVQLGGEPMFAEDLERFRRHFPRGCWLGVGMGATEAGHVLGCFLDHDSRVSPGALPTGYPAEGMRVWIADENGREVPYGTPGRITVSGPFLSPGYWKTPAAERASVDDDPPQARVRVHATGDIGRMDADRLVTHMAREDGRVKVRGHRVETAEIEAVLRRIRGVRESAVVVQQRHEEAHLAAFVVPEIGAGIDSAAIMRDLRQSLPDYMIPFSLAVLDAMPELPNGKLDREALRELEPGFKAASSHPVPRYILEEQLAAMWEELLGHRSFGMDDDFYDVGGNSLLAAELVTRIEDQCGVTLDLPRFATGMTVAQLCAVVVAGEAGGLTGGPLVRIQTGAGAAPLFFHSGDIETGGLYCRNLARHLGSDLPFYMIVPHGLDGGPVPASIQAMAADRIHALRAVQPVGPYRLGGFCYGGKVAYEMARMLEDAGERVDSVVVIDTRAGGRDGPGDTLPSVVLQDPLTGANRIGMAIAKVRFGQRALYGAYRVLRNALRMMRRLGVGTTLLRIGRKARRIIGRRVAARSAVRVSLGEDIMVPEVPTLLDDGTVHELSAIASRLWRPAPFGGRVVLLHSSRIGPDDVDSEKAAWEGAAKTFAMRSVPGTHRSCITKHVADVAQEMRGVIESVAAAPRWMTSLPVESGEPSRT